MKNYVLLAISMLFVANLSAQESDYYPYRSNRYLGIEGIYNCTLLDLDANNYRDGGGFSISGFKDITSNRNPLVLQWGGEGLFAVSGKDREYYIDDAFGTYRISSPTNLTFGLNGLLRLEYRKYRVHPYIDGFVGGRLFSSGYTDNDNCSSCEDDYQAMTTTGRLTYGMGAGVFVPVSNRLDINFRAAYTHAPEMYYINMNDFIDNTRNTLAPLAESEYDMLSFHVGVRYRFEQQNKEERRREKRERRDRDCYDSRYDCDSPCDNRRRQRRQRAGNILQGICIGLDIYNSSRSREDDCPADSYPDRNDNWNDDDDDDNWNDDRDDDNWNDNDSYTPPPRSGSNSGSNNTCPPAYDNNTSSNPQPSYTPRPSKGTRSSSSSGSTRSGSNPNRSVRSGKGVRGGQ